MKASYLGVSLAVLYLSNTAQAEPTGLVSTLNFGFTIVSDANRLEALSQITADSTISEACTSEILNAESSVQIVEDISFDAAITDGMGVEEELLLTSLCSTRLNSYEGATCSATTLTSEPGSGKESARLTIDLSNISSESAEAFKTTGIVAGLEDFYTNLGTLLSKNLSSLEFASETDNGHVSLTYNMVDAEVQDPLTTEALDAVATCNSAVVTNAGAIVRNLGGYEQNSIPADLCAGRDCNGKGTCESTTGICSCPADANGDFWWGINCMTKCECSDHGSCLLGVCNCEFPYFGLRCADTKDCGCTAP